MEIQLQELIEQIKKDGVWAAETKSASILEAANAEASKIISDAKAEAAEILRKAKEENERMVRVSEDAIRQAGRNLLLSFRESVAKELDAVVGEKVAASYSSEKLAQLILKVAQSWSNTPEAEDITILLNEKDAAEIKETLLAALKERMISGVTLKVNNNFENGFRIAVNNGRAYYDYSGEAVTELLSAYLNPKVTALLKEAEGV